MKTFRWLFEKTLTLTWQYLILFLNDTPKTVKKMTFLQSIYDFGKVLLCKTSKFIINLNNLIKYFSRTLNKKYPNYLQVYSNEIRVYQRINKHKNSNRIIYLSEVTLKWKWLTEKTTNIINLKYQINQALNKE